MHVTGVPEALFPRVLSQRAFTDAGTFTVRDFVRVLFKHKLLIAFVAVLVTASVAAGLLYLPPVYEAEAKLLVRTEQLGNLSVFSGIAAYREPHESDPVPRKLETEMEVLTTRELSERVVDRLGLSWHDANHKPLNFMLRPVAEVYDRLLAKWFGVPVDPDQYGREATVKAFNESIVVAPTKSRSSETTSNVIKVQIRASKADVAQKGLQTLLDEYVGYSVEQSRRIGEAAVALVSDRLRAARTELASAEGGLRRFLAERGDTLTSRSAAANRNPAAAAGDGMVTPGSADPSRAVTLQMRLVDYELRLLEMQQTFTDRAENVRLLQQTIGDLRARVKAEQRVSANSDSTLATLQRGVRAAEQHVLLLQDKHDQLAAYLALSATEVDSRKVTEPALRPRSSEWKSKLAVGVMGAIAGIALGLGLAGYREYSDPRLQSAAAAERYLHMQVLAVIPDDDRLRWRTQPRSLDAERVGWPIPRLGALFGREGGRNEEPTLHGRQG